MQALHRKHPGLIYKVTFLFAFVATFTFLALRLPRESQAVSLADFRPGNIISDYTMGNYTTMSVADIDAFLHAHGNCNDRDTVKASWYPNLHYHIKDGHFVCLADERFSLTTPNYGDLLTDGEASKTAAEIIYDAAQTYHINPQVLLVLLEKEQGLISDSWPNSIQFRSATGFGCPDTAACDAEYYGLRNQIESAAWLFRTVLDGGWTNYPLGENYIAYSPNAACGGSIVNIENLATSSLYRYTPYQPNAAALAAGYGTVTCGAYGNRNFFLFFTNWFGDPTITKEEPVIDETIYGEVIPSGKYTILSALGTAIDVKSGSTQNGANIWTYTANQTSAQEFELIYDETSGVYTISNPNSGKVLDVYGGLIENGTNVQIYTSNNTCAQQWKIRETEDNFYEIVSACSNKVLDVAGANANAGTNIQIYASNHSSAQKWQFVPIVEEAEDETLSGKYTITSALGTVLDVYAGSTKDGTNVWMYTANQTTAQEFELTYDETDDTYVIINPRSGKALDVYAGSTQHGANVQIYTSNRTCAQKWHLEKTEDDYYTITSACSGKALDVYAGSTQNGANVQIYTPNSTKAQKWQLTPIKEN